MPRLPLLLTLLLCLFPLPALAGPLDPPATIPDTGQTKCYNAAGAEIACAGTGQDGEISNNPMSFTTLAGGMVKDNVTGLIWETKTNKDGVKNYADPHDADNTYTWYDPNTATNGGNAGTASTNDTLDFITALNNAAFGGYTDWRLPSREELRSIVDYSIPYPGPTINTGYFPNTALVQLNGNAYKISKLYYGLIHRQHPDFLRQKPVSDDISHSTEPVPRIPSRPIIGRPVPTPVTRAARGTCTSSTATTASTLSRSPGMFAPCAAVSDLVIWEFDYCLNR